MRESPLHLQTLGIGFSAGFLNGLIGLGGGIIVVPGLVLLRGIEARAAVATSLVVVLAMSGAALVGHLLLAAFQFSLGGTGLLLVCAALGAQAGSWLLHRIPERWILALLSAFCLLSAGNLAAVALNWVAPLALAGTAPPLWSYLAFGAGSGLLSGLMGLGGGSFTVLAFSVFFQVPILGGVPLALMVNVTNALSGLAANWRSGQIRWNEIVRLAPAVAVGVAIGIGIAHLLPADALRLVFALFFVYLGMRLAQRAARPKPA